MQSWIPRELQEAKSAGHRLYHLYCSHDKNLKSRLFTKNHCAVLITSLEESLKKFLAASTLTGNSNFFKNISQRICWNWAQFEQDFVLCVRWAWGWRWLCQMNERQGSRRRRVRMNRPPKHVFFCEYGGYFHAQPEDSLLQLQPCKSRLPLGTMPILKSSCDFSPRRKSAFSDALWGRPCSQG